MVHMGDAVEVDRVDSPVGSLKGSQGAKRWGASRGRVWRGLGRTGGLAARPGAGPIGVEPQAYPAG